jgi:hypothetical protein
MLRTNLYLILIIFKFNRKKIEKEEKNLKRKKKKLMIENGRLPHDIKPHQHCCHSMKYV